MKKGRPEGEEPMTMHIRKHAHEPQFVAKRASSIFRSVVVLILLSPTASLLVAQQNSYQNNIGVPSFTVAAPVENGFINIANGNLHLEVPLEGPFPQRGGRSFRAVLMYDSAFWYRNPGTPTATWRTNGGGWRLVTSADTGSTNYTTSYITCFSSTYQENVTTEIDFKNFEWIAPDGTQHLFPIKVSAGYNPDPVDCTAGQTVTTGNAFATDRSGYKMFVTTNGGSQVNTINVYAPDGTQVYGPDRFATTGPKDPNGNYYTRDANFNTRLAHYNPSDTLGRSPIMMSANGSSDYIDVLNSHGDRHRYTVVWQTIGVNTNFGQVGVAEWSNTIQVIQEIDLPDGTKYQFTYDQGTTSGHYGVLTSMTLPTGGQISYSYTTFPDSYSNRYRRINGRTTSGAGITGGTWSYIPLVLTTCPVGQVNCGQKVTVTTPSNDATVYTFNFNGGPWASQIQSYTGSPTTGTLLATVSQSFDYGTGCPANVQCNDPGAAYVAKQLETTILPITGGTNLNQSRRLTWDASKNGNVNKAEEWGFYTGSLPTTADRTTTYTYLTGTNYLSINLVNRPVNVTVTDKSANTVSQTLSAYDGSSLVSITGTPNHDDAHFGTGMTYRGNLTQTQRLVSGTSNFLTSSLSYDTTGQIRVSTDAKGNQTSFDYANNFYDDPGDGTSPTSHAAATATNAQVKTITLPTVGSITPTLTLGYYWGSGKQAVETDENGQTSYSHFYESMDRPTSAALPNGQWSRIQYNSTGTQVDSFIGTTSTSASVSCSVCRHDQTQFDVLGRSSKEILVNDPDGQTTVASTYDSSGRIATKSNPYRTTSDPTYGLETPAYDGLGRIIQSTHPDTDVARVYYGAAVSTGGGTSTRNCSVVTYGLGYPVLSVDEVGRKHQTWTDGFGRVIETDEPNAAGSLAVGTCYSYDINNNLTGVANTATSQTRSYSYDLLSRVSASTTPESGTTYFYYTTTIGGATLCSGDPTAICLRKDSRNITTTYAYDALNRLTSKTYSDPTTAAASYFYDQTSYNGLTITNGKDRRTGMSDGSGQTAWSYDSVGNVLAERRTVKGVTKTLSYTYNPDGSIATITYPGGRVVTYTEGNAQRITDVKDVPNAKNFVTSATYAPLGGLSSALHGYVSGGFAGITESYGYNNRLQISSILATSSAGTAVNLAYTFAQSGHNNSNIATQTNGLSSGRTQTYTYDPLNRLLSAQSAATSGTECWGLTFGNNATPPTLATDALNNLTNMNQTKCAPPFLNVGVNNNNQINSPTGYSYDAAGNSTADGSYTYTYDAENQILTASNVPGGPYCYTYDGDGLRVVKAHGTSCASPTIDVLYWRSVSGETIATTGASGSTSDSAHHEFIFFDGRRIARSDGASPGTIYYLFADHLGSTRAMTQSNGVMCFASDYYPYGQELNFLNTCPLGYKFTGYERDTESGLDYAFARYYNPRIGRFMSGDPLGGDILDPQSLNLYSYVGANPENRIDSVGMSPDEATDWFAGFWASDSRASGTSWGPQILAGRNSNPVAKVWEEGLRRYFETAVGFNVRADGTILRFLPGIQLNICISFNNIPDHCTDAIYPGKWVGTGSNLYDSSLKMASDFSAGAGDCLTGRCIPFVHNSLTEMERRREHIDNLVDKNGTSYLVGEITGGAVASGIIGGAGVAKGGWMNSNRYLRIGWSKKGGNRVFRFGGKLIEKFRSSGKLDIFTGGKL
jgi:RHS repeat-associated protein